VPIAVGSHMAGVPSPVSLTPWKEAALKVMAILRTNGAITTKQIQECGISPTAWTRPNGPKQAWLSRGDVRGTWIESENLPKFDVQHPEAYAIVFGIMAAAGCVCAGTDVWTNSGDCVKIESLKQSDGILGFDLDKEQNAKQTISWMNPPALKECVEIKTATRSLKCSLDHPILVRAKENYKTDEIIGVRRDYYKKLDKWYETPKKKTESRYSKVWKLAGDIKPSDVILCTAGVDIWGDYEMFDARLIGMLIGDGSYGMRRHYNKIEFKTPSFSNCDEELLKYIFDKYQYNIELQRPTKDGRLYHEISIRGLIPSLKEIGIAGQSKNKKRLPTNYRKLTKKDAALLQVSE